MYVVERVPDGYTRAVSGHFEGTKGRTVHRVDNPVVEKTCAIGQQCIDSTMGPILGKTSNCGTVVSSGASERIACDVKVKVGTVFVEGKACDVIGKSQYADVGSTLSEECCKKTAESLEEGVKQIDTVDTSDALQLIALDMSCKDRTCCTSEGSEFVKTDNIDPDSVDDDQLPDSDTGNCEIDTCLHTDLPASQLLDVCGVTNETAYSSELDKRQLGGLMASETALCGGVNTPGTTSDTRKTSCSSNTDADNAPDGVDVESDDIDNDRLCPTDGRIESVTARQETIVRYVIGTGWVDFKGHGLVFLLSN